MLRSQKYIPCLRWKLGEYQAVSKLSPSTRDSILPILEVSEFGSDIEYDFEANKRPQTLDKHLSMFTTRVKSKWGTSECFLDMRYIPHSQALEDGRSPTDFVFDDLKAKNVHFIPVIRFQEDQFYEATLHNFVNGERRGFCLRVNLDEFGEDDFETNAEELLQRYRLVFSECDLILDLGAINFEPIDIFSNLLTNMMKSKPELRRWMNFGLIGTSFPQTLSGLQRGISFLPRNEWVLYKSLIKGLQKEGVRVPIFGDYVINNPKLQKIDMRIVKPKANIRYSIADKWLIARGDNVRDYKFFQFQQLCQSIIETQHYCGQPYSYGDDYIFRCAQGIAKTGSLSTWREVGTNHHIEMVVRDLAKLVAS